MWIHTVAVTLNAAFLREIKEDNHELFRLLRTVEQRLSRFSASPPVRAAKSLASLLERLRDQLAMHFALEEAYGYFDDPISVAPQMSAQAERLRGEHRVLYLQCCDIAELAAEVAYHEVHGSRAGDLVTRFDEFHRQFQRHEAHENELIVRALCDDIGVGD